MKTVKSYELWLTEGLWAGAGTPAPLDDLVNGMICVDAGSMSYGFVTPWLKRRHQRNR